jgi:hypothetical protein
MASEDCPEDAIETTVWRLEKGGTQLTKEKIFSLAVAPDFVEKAHNDIVASGKMSAVQMLKHGLTSNMWKKEGWLMDLLKREGLSDGSKRNKKKNF